MFELTAGQNCSIYGTNYKFNSKFSIDDPLVLMENRNNCRIEVAHRRNPKPVKGKKIIIHQNGVAKVGGMETLLKNLCDKYPDADVTFYYGWGDVSTIIYLSKNWECHLYNGEQLEADIIILMSCDSDNIVIDKCKADKIYSFFGHQDWSVFKDIADKNKYWSTIKINKSDKVTKALSVSEASRDGLKKVWGIDSEVVPNILLEPTKPLKLFTASRLSPDKGTENLITLIDEMCASGKDFIWLIAGGNKAVDGVLERLRCYPQVVLIESNDNARWLVDWCDWCVVTSQGESFCYAAYEALQCGVPVVMLECNQAHAIIKDGNNGYIFRQDLQDFSVDKLYKKPKIKLDIPDQTCWEKMFKGTF